MRNFCALLFFSVALTAQLGGILAGINLTVKTLNGKVEGFLGKSCRGQTPFVGFRGIPYAEPPLGALRFKDPVPKKNWWGVYNATYQRPSCLQGSEEFIKLFPETTVFSEDCLYLNVYTPNVKYLEGTSSSLKAVMVFIHMGGFIMGSGDESFISPDFLLDQDVVVVTFNYRLGALGFLSLQNSEVPGNAGLKDQNLVLKWVKRNVKSFGGNPEKITIFGESAGSASVNYHLLSPLSEGLFSKAIMESGTVLTPWAYSPSDLALKKSISLGQKLGCAVTAPLVFLKCLQAIPAEKIRDYQQKALTLEEILTLRIIAFHPTTEPEVPGAFITKKPFDLMYYGNFTKVPVIIGSNADEGLLLYSPLTKYDPLGLLPTLVGMDLSRFAPYNFHLKPFSKLAIQVHKKISQFYFEGQMITKKSFMKILELITDTMFVMPIQLTASLIADTFTPVYNYQFTYEGDYGIGKLAGGINKVPGVCHGDEIGYIFYNERIHPNCGKNLSDISSVDELMIDRMTKMWSNFAKTGNPTAKTDNDVPVKWELFTRDERNYLNIGMDLVPSNNLKLANMLFWEDLIQELIAATAEDADESFEDETIQLAKFC